MEWKRIRLNEKYALATADNDCQTVIQYSDNQELSQLYSLLLERYQPSVQTKPHDFHYEHAGRQYRAHIYHHMGGWSVCLKRLPAKMKNLMDLGFAPMDIHELIKSPGLTLFVGPIDNGKSTSMASTVLFLYKKGLLGEAVTIEEPVEYIFRLPEITQRRVGDDIASHEEGIYQALRESPQTIVIGEIRDRPTAQAAIHAGMVGHLVLSTLHGNDVVDGISKMFALLDSEHDEVLPQALSGVVAQRLVKNKEGETILLYETLKIDQAARSVLLGGPKKLQELGNIFHDQGRARMQDNAAELVRQGILDQAVLNESFKS